LALLELRRQDLRTSAEGQTGFVEQAGSLVAAQCPFRKNLLVEKIGSDDLHQFVQSLVQFLQNEISTASEVSRA
jgi:hypothetical protein